MESDRRGEPHDQEHDTDDERDHIHTLTVPALGFEFAVTCDRGGQGTASASRRCAAGAARSG
ncbi:hypothetical protein GCM10009777_20240 [Microbacterium pumilum]|uniref:Uncharacterized protein n=1 Tax=Microbacterium pumilum TaxID=344165 RepID=A0ABN2SG41_9MICO